MRFTALKTLLPFNTRKKSSTRRPVVTRFRRSVEVLEDRRLLSAVRTVDDNNPADFTTIQAAVDASSPGDTIKVRPGTYAGNVEVDVKRLTIIGGQPFNASDSGPSIVKDDAYGFSLLESEITIKNFTIQPDLASVGASGIVTSENFSGYKILNNTIHDVINGVLFNTSLASSAKPSLVDGNRFTEDLDNGVSSDKGLRNATISNNNFTGDAVVSVRITATQTSTNVCIVNNQIINDAPIQVINLTKSKISGNAITNPDTIADELTAAILLGGGVTWTEVSRNTLIAGPDTPTGDPDAATQFMDGIALKSFLSTQQNNYNTIAWNTVLGNLDAFFEGINIDGTGTNGAHHNTIDHNTVQKCEDDGIQLAGGAAYNTVSLNTSTLNDEDGITVFESNNNTLTCNTTNNNRRDGIDVLRSKLNTLSSNTSNLNFRFGIVLGFFDSAIREPSDQNKVLNNTVSYNTSNGLVVTGDQNTISYNTVNFNGLLPGNTGIFLGAANNNNVSSNTANNNGFDGIGLFSGNFTATGNTVAKNTLKNNAASGIGLYNADNNKILENYAYNNRLDGIHLEDSSDGNTISKNTASHNGQDGIHLLEDSDLNIVSYNTTNDNVRYGIHVEAGSGGPLEKNTITRNKAKNNSTDLVDGSGTTTENDWTNNTANSRSPAGLG
jgi:parallel beta-helix repeat protein